MLFREQPTDPWTELDFLLVEAIQILEDETCPECGNPIWVCRNESAANVGFKVKVATCYAKAELDKWTEKESKKKETAKKHGQYPYTVAYTYDGSDMPSRMQFYQELSKRNAVE